MDPKTFVWYIEKDFILIRSDTLENSIRYFEDIYDKYHDNSKQLSNICNELKIFRNKYNITKIFGDQIMIGETFYDLLNNDIINVIDQQRIKKLWSEMSELDMSNKIIVSNIDISKNILIEWMKTHEPKEYDN